MHKNNNNRTQKKREAARADTSYHCTCRTANEKILFYTMVYCEKNSFRITFSPKKKQKLEILSDGD
jgi:hypothetical protein